jgi:hypothetical protein
MTVTQPNGFTRAVRRWMAGVAALCLTLIWGSYVGGVMRSAFNDNPWPEAPPIMFSAFLLLVAIGGNDQVAAIVRQMLQRK